MKSAILKEKQVQQNLLKMKIQHHQKKESGSFFMKEGEDTRAEMTYELSPDGEMVINHTEVDEDLRGKDFGKNLVKAAVDYSRQKGIKIIPICSFAASVFENTHDYKDVLAKVEE